MARGSMTTASPWRLRSFTIPPTSLRDWLRLAVWELWMGAIICALLFAGASMIATSPDRIITAEDLSGCYDSPPVTQPCERIVYRTGAMNAAFSVLIGLVMSIAAIWLVWELWDAVAPKAITDDFLRLLHHSFARNWRDPRTWPWSRLLLAYGFALIGAAVAASTVVAFRSVFVPPAAEKRPVISIEQQFRIGS
jgi:hypothetical protein